MAVRCGVVWCGAVRYGAVWCGGLRVRCGVAWCGVVWYGAVCTPTHQSIMNTFPPPFPHFFFFFFSNGETRRSTQNKNERQNVTDAEKRWEMAKERFGEGHLHEMSCAQGVAMALNNLALALKGRGDVQGAEPLLRRALDVSVFARAVEWLLLLLLSLICLFRLTVVVLRLSSPFPNLSRLPLNCCTSTPPPLPPDLETTSTRRQMSIESQGAEHPEVATRLNSLALLLASDGRVAEAEGLHRQ